MARAVVALCRWEDFNYAAHRPGSALYDRHAPAWLPRNEPPTACRASLAEHVLTVWLPQGAVIRHRVYVPPSLRLVFSHVYGSHERMTRTRIRITLTEYPTP